jgi:preprotein translocase subunit SecG
MAGFAGEGGSVIALYLQRADHATRFIVLLATLFLLCGVLLPAMHTYLNAADKKLRAVLGEAASEARPSSIPETAKTDTEG